MLLIEMANGYEEALLKIQTYLRENKENLSNTTINYLRQTMHECKESSMLCRNYYKKGGALHDSPASESRSNQKLYGQVSVSRVPTRKRRNKSGRAKSCETQPFNCDRIRAERAGETSYYLEILRWLISEIYC